MKKHILITTIAIIIIVAGSIYFSIKLKTKPSLAFVSVKKGDITQGVRVDGTVQSAQDLALAFEQGGTVAEVNVKAGDTVKAGQILARLDAKNLAATVSQAQAAVSTAQANFEKLSNGATNSDVDVAQSAVASAQTALINARKNQTATVAQQNLIVNNAQVALLNSSLSAAASPNNIGTQNPTISGTYTGTTQGQYQVSIYSTGSGLRFTTTGLESFSGQASNSSPVAMGTFGLYIQFPPGQVYTGDSWTVSIPNTKAANYLTNLNSYNAALQTQNQALTAAQSTVDQAQASLDQANAALQLKKTPARPEDLDTARAQIQAAQAQLQTAQNAYSKSTLTAPIDGVITSVEAKVGQTLSGSTLAPGLPAVKMISVGKFQIVTYISEADIGKVKVSDPASISLDAYGNSTPFDATVISIDPSATINAGVSTYKTTLEFNKTDSKILDGMAASVVIIDQKHPGVLIIPTTTIIKKNDQSFVLADTGNGQVKQTQIVTGITDLNGNTEVVSGLNEGQNIATFGNQ